MISMMYLKPKNKCLKNGLNVFKTHYLIHKVLNVFLTNINTKILLLHVSKKPC